MSKLVGETNSAEYKRCITQVIEAMPTDQEFTKEDVANVLETTDSVDLMIIGETLLNMSSLHPMSLKKGSRFFCWFGNSPRIYYWMEEE